MTHELLKGLFNAHIHAVILNVQASSDAEIKERRNLFRDERECVLCCKAFPSTIQT